MFGEIAIVALLVVAVGLGIHLAATVWRKRRPGVRRPRYGWVARAVYAVLLLSTAVLGGTSLYSVIPSGIMHGWLLWLHLLAAGAFVVALPVAAILWAEASRFGGARAPEHAAQPRMAVLTRVSFWVILLAGTIALATMLFGMGTVLGTQEIRTMTSIHRYAGLAVVLAAVVHLYSVCLARAGRG